MTTHKPNAVILANCTHISLAKALRKSGHFNKVDSVEVYTVAPERREEVANSLAGYEFIMTLDHGEAFGSLSTAALRERYGCRVFSLPTPFFSGVMPDMAYLTLRSQISRAPGVLGDYHSGLILTECRDGFSEDEIVRRYADGSAFERLDIQGIWDDGLAELKRREVSCDISISDYIRQQKELNLITEDFLSFNHPREGLINYITKLFLNLALGVDDYHNGLLPEEHNLYQDARWPTHPVVAERLGLTVPKYNTFRSPNRLGGEEMSIADFARRSCRFLRSNTPINHFQIHTPWFLDKKIHPLPYLSTASTSIEPVQKKKQIVLNHFGRSGSTVLAMMLQQHPSIAWLHEFFSLYSIKSRETYNFALPEMRRMVTAAAEEEWSRQPDRFVGHEIKLMNFLQNPSCGIEEYLSACADPDQFIHILLLRKNTLRRILSVYKAMRSKVYHSNDDSYRNSKVSYSVDFSNLFDPDTGQRAASLVELIEKSQACENSIVDLYRKNNIPHFLITYEDDIESSPERAYNKIIHWLGLPERSANVTLSKTGAPLWQEISNFEEVVFALKGSRFEWMLGEIPEAKQPESV
jgi:hypothetical protein